MPLPLSIAFTSEYTGVVSPLDDEPPPLLPGVALGLGEILGTVDGSALGAIHGAEDG